MMQGMSWFDSLKGYSGDSYGEGRVRYPRYLVEKGFIEIFGDGEIDWETEPKTIGGEHDPRRIRDKGESW